MNEEDIVCNIGYSFVKWRLSPHSSRQVSPKSYATSYTFHSNYSYKPSPPPSLFLLGNGIAKQKMWQTTPN